MILKSLYEYKTSPLRLYAAIILEIMYGMEVTQMDDYYIHTAEVAVSAVATVLVPGKFWVEFMPLLKGIPSWVPGAYFKRYIEKFAPEVNKMIDEPFDAVKQDMVCSGPIECHLDIYVLRLLS